MSTAKKVLSIAVRVILWIIILLAALFAFTTLATRSNDRVANVAGYTPMTVLTESMSPTFNAGDLIIIKKCDPETLQVGDIVTFHTIIENEYALNTHRIVEIQTRADGMDHTFHTKGDNVTVEDPRTVSDGDIVGKYVGRVPYLGHVMQFLSSSIGFLIVIVLPLLVFFIFQVYNLVMVSIKLKKATAAEAAAEAAATDENAQAAEAARKEAEAALEEARRIKAEAEAALAQAKAAASGNTQGTEDPAAPAAEETAEAAADDGKPEA